MRYAIYPRKSKKRDDSESMQMQIDKCTAYIVSKEPNASIAVYDGDYGVTGHSIKNRTDFKRMMDDVKNGDIDCVVIYKYDRIARNMYDFVVLYHQLEESKCDLISVSQEIDTSTPMGKNMMYQLASWAELEWSMTSQRYRDTFDYMNKAGLCHRGTRLLPIGYKRDKDTKKCVKDEKYKEYCNDMIESYLETGSLRATIDRLNSKYEEKFTTRILRTFLFGDIPRGRFKGNLNFCEPYIDEDTARKIDKIREFKARTFFHESDNKRPYLFSSLMKCPKCGHNMVGACKYKKNMHYYRCNYHTMQKLCDFKTGAREDRIESQLIDMIQLKATYKVKKERKRPVSADKKKAELERLTNAYIKGRISEDDYDIKYNEISAEIRQIEAKNSITNIDDARVFTGDWLESYQKLNSENKKIFWKKTIQEIILDYECNVVDIIFF